MKIFGDGEQKQLFLESSLRAIDICQIMCLILIDVPTASDQQACKSRYVIDHACPVLCW